MGKFDFLSQELDALDESRLLRRLRQIDSAQGPVVTFAHGGQKVLFCSKNYLGLANDESVKIAAIKAVEKYGTGSAASRLISEVISVSRSCRYTSAIHAPTVGFGGGVDRLVAELRKTTKRASPEIHGSNDGPSAVSPSLFTLTRVLGIQSQPLLDPVISLAGY